MTKQEIDDLVLRNIELQKRIDEVLMYLRHTDFREAEEDILRKILKGNQNE